MTDNLPAVVQQTSREITTTDTDSWVAVVRDVSTLAQQIAGTEFVPRQLRNSPAAVTAAILYGREVGLPPMTALTQTHVIEGKPSMSAEAMRALVFAAGHELIVDEASGAIVRMRARRATSQEWTPLAWTIDQARAAGLTGKDNWKKYPRSMLLARCTAELCRMVFPDVIHGFRALEEFDELLEDAAEEPTAPTTKVGRARKAAAKKTAAAPLERPAERPAVSGPPLPGEDGYDEPSPRVAAPEQAGEVSGGAQGAGEPDAAPAVDVSDAGTSGVVLEGSESDDGHASDEENGSSASETPEQADKSHPALITRPQQRMLMGQFSSFELAGDDDRDERLRIVSAIAGREVDSTSSLTKVEATRVIDTLAKVEGPEQLLAIASGGQ